MPRPMAGVWLYSATLMPVGASDTGANDTIPKRTSFHCCYKPLRAGGNILRSTGRIIPRPRDPAVLTASHRKLGREFAWEPRHSELEEIIKGAWEWEQAQYEHMLVKQGS